MSRTISSRYSDPLDLIWTNTAQAMGLTIARTEDAYASTDGRGTLFVGAGPTMDEDDCLAQMIFHEICHWMVQGPQSLHWVDWGLDNEERVDDEKEHACLRLQAALLSPYGLRTVLAPTTDFRAYYDALPLDPFELRVETERESITRALSAYARRNQSPFRSTLKQALQATESVVRAATTTHRSHAPSRELCYRIEAPLPLHRTGLPKYTDEQHSCGACAWYYESGKKRLGRCRQSGGKRTDDRETACSHFEAPFDCLSCGACCREAYDTVEVSPRDPARRLHLELLVERTGGYDMGRTRGRCRCLRGGIALKPPRPSISGGLAPDDAAERLPPLAMPGNEPFTCEIYETRPKTCRDFTIFSGHCLYARQRVGLSR